MLLLSCDWNNEMGCMLWRALFWTMFQSGYPSGMSDVKELTQDEVDRLLPYSGASTRDGCIYFEVPKREVVE